MKNVTQYRCINCKRIVNKLDNVVTGSYVNEVGEEIYTYNTTYVFACECKAGVEEINSNTLQE